MKSRYRKLLACELYIKETKKHWWSPWKITCYGGAIPIAYRRVNGKFVRETDYILRMEGEG